jgi:hypothetical protein
MKLKVALYRSDVNPITGGYQIEAVHHSDDKNDGRRFFYCYPDGKPRHGIYLRELNELDCERLENAIHQAGFMIDISKSCWQESDPVYGSIAYELSGIELHWLERERVEANW